MKRTLLLLVGAFVAIAVVVWLREWQFAGALAPGGAATAGEPLAGPTADERGSSAGNPGAGERVAATGPGDGGGVVGSRRVRFAIVLPDQQPAAGAEVRFWPARTQVRRESDARVWGEANDLEVALRATGELVVADVRGVVEIDAEDDSELCARLGGFYAQTDLAGIDAPPPAEPRLELQRDVSLRVLVVDTEGRPREGITVAAAVNSASRRDGPQSRDAPVGRSDALGLVAMPHAQRSLPMPGAGIVDWSMTIWCGTSRTMLAQCVVLPADLVAAEPIRLVVPVGGTVVAEVVDAEGKPWGFCEVMLEDPRFGTVFANDQDSRAGLSFFRQVPLGRSWSVRVPKEGETSTSVVGPVRPDEVVRVRLQLPQRRWEIQGRVVRTDGTALVGARIAWQTKAFGRGAVELESRHEGRFRFQGGLPATVASIDDLTLSVAHPLLAGPCAIRIDRILLPGVLDLGDLAVPVPQDEVVLATVEVRCEGRTITASPSVVLEVFGDNGVDTLGARVTKRLEGQVIVLRGRPPGRPMELRCSHSDCLSSGSLPIHLGEHKVVDLQPAAELRVRVEPPDVPAALVGAHLVLLKNGEQCGSDCYSAEVGGWAWRKLVPGRYSLRILAGDRVLVELPAIELKAGPNVWPADGALLDLRGKARVIYLDARPADGNGRIENAITFAVPAGASAWPSDLDRVELPYPNWFVPRERPTDLLFTAPGFVPVRLSNPTADTTLHLQRCTTLRVTGPRGEFVTTIVRIVVDAVADQLLRDFDPWNQHTAFDTTDPAVAFERTFAPGTVVEVLVSRNGVEGPAQRIVVGATSPQDVVAR